MLRQGHRPGTGSSYPSDLTNVNGTLFFAANDGTSGVELWKSDGTAAGTVLVKDIRPGPAARYPELPDERRRHAVLRGQRRRERQRAVEERRHGGRHRAGQGHPPGRAAARSPATSRTWAGRSSSRPTTARAAASCGRATARRPAPSLVKDINPGADGSDPQLPRRAWAARSSSRPTTARAAASCGRATGPTPAPSLVKDITPGAVRLRSRLRSTERGRDALLRGQRRHERPRAVEERRDGGRHRPGQGHQPGASGSTPIDLTNVDGTLFFAANDGTNGAELWKSDGTAAGTVAASRTSTRVAELDPRSDLTNVDGTLFFAANDGANGDELWKSDGTSAGTVAGQGHPPGLGSSDPGDLTNVERHAVLRGQRRHERQRAVEERRDRGRHRAGQGHRPGLAGSYPD